MDSKGWLKVGYAPQQEVTLNFPDDGVEAQFQPRSGDGWQIDSQGKQNVGFQPNKLSIYCSTVSCFQ